MCRDIPVSLQGSVEVREREGERRKEEGRGGEREGGGREGRGRGEGGKEVMSLLSPPTVWTGGGGAGDWFCQRPHLPPLLRGLSAHSVCQRFSTGLRIQTGYRVSLVCS